jgi:hypothetical protein
MDIWLPWIGNFWGLREVVKGPLEAARIKLQMLEALVGRPVRRAARGGRLGPAGKWLLRELRAGRMTQHQQDLLGLALEVEQDGMMVAAQTALDELAATFEPERLRDLAASVGQVPKCRGDDAS